MSKHFFALLHLIPIILVSCTPVLGSNNESHSSTSTVSSTLQPNFESIITSTVTTTNQLPTITSMPQQTIEYLVTSTPEFTILTGTLNIVSEPASADVEIIESTLKGKTPYSATLASGNYLVRLTLEGYKSWEEIVQIHAGETAEIRAQLIPNHRVTGQYIPLIELGGIGATDERLYLVSVTLTIDQSGFVYGIRKGWNGAEAKDWSWFHYNLLNGENLAKAPPQSIVNAETRIRLNLCPLDETEWTGSVKCNRLTTLIESSTNQMIVYSPILEDSFNEGELWLSDADGSNAQKLADFAPFYAHWSNDGQWFVTGRQFPGLPGQATHFLVATDSSFIEALQQISGIDSFYLNGLFPEFSPDGSHLLFAGSEIPESREEDDYNLYILNLDNLEVRLASERLGLFQWAEDSKGIYVLDGAFSPFDVSESSQMRETNLYYVGITNEAKKESLIASGIPFYPLNAYGTWNWAYSPEQHAIAYVGFHEKLELGTLLLVPSE